MIIEAKNIHGETVNIEDVPSGKKCNCICLVCKTKLVAKKGNKKRHYFAHLKKSDCTGIIHSESKREYNLKGKLGEKPEEHIYTCQEETEIPKGKDTLLYLWDKLKTPFYAKSKYKYVKVVKETKYKNKRALLGKIANEFSALKNKSLTRLENIDRHFWNIYIPQ